ncbi:Hypothetical predicted protein [Mytilus galloprovincialis]|uniref:C1q domain-containing protein n=1 Tax=Mytilus galloprovincialis TaxID=29158 RepID=A0A8B6FXM8_MYTGA|nr:Hypothetical predicted protein [Mytilus galloprovincialis]
MNGRTQPPTVVTGQVLTDKHFYMLMDIVTEQRNVRLKQSIEIAHLKSELIATQHIVTSNFHSSHSGNDTLKTVLDIMEENIRKMVSNYSSLQNEFNLVKAELNELKLNNSRTNQYARLLEQELSNVKQLKNVANLQTVLNLTDDVKRLEHGQHITNNKISSIDNDVSARKQDFVALFNKAELTERNLDLTLKIIETNFSSLTQHTDNSLNKSFSYFETRFQMLTDMQNVSTGKLKKEIHSMSDRDVMCIPFVDIVAVTACALQKPYSLYERIQFLYVKTNIGVTDSVISSLKSTGNFKCVKPGLYFVSSYIMSNTNGNFYLKKNSGIIAEAYFSLNSGAQTSTIMQLILLGANDTLSIFNGNSKNIYGNNRSCISILQLTG